LTPDEPADEAAYKASYDKWAKAAADFKAAAKEARERTKEQNKANEAAAKEIEAAFTPEVATANKKGSELSNGLREAMGAAPLVLDVETAKEANEFLNKWVCTDANEQVTEVQKDMVMCVKPAEKRRLAEGDCYENNWTNPSPADGTTSAMAVQAWYD